MAEFFWDQELRRYRDKDGEVIRESIIRRGIDDMTAALSLIFISRAEKLRLEFSREAWVVWNTANRLDINSMHYAMAMLAYGGRERMTEEDWRMAEAIILFHISKFDSFARDLVNGQIEADGNLPVRTSLYALAGYSSYQAHVRDRERSHKTEEKRIVRSGNPCAICAGEAAKGWVPIGTLRAIGDSYCITRCRCIFVFR